MHRYHRCRDERALPNVPVPGANPYAVGLPSLGLCGHEMLDVLLPLAGPSTIHSPISPTNRGIGVVFPCLWRIDVHVINGGGYDRCYEEGTRRYDDVFERCYCDHLFGLLLDVVDRRVQGVA